MAQKVQQLPLPSFYDPKNAAVWVHTPDIQKVFDEAFAWRKQFGIQPSGGAKRKIHLLGIDYQNDFCIPQGTLYVGGRSGTGAIDDSRRFVEFVYRNLAVLSDMTLTLDSHFAFQIFFTSFWLDQDGKHPAPFTAVTTADIVEGKLRPNPVVASLVGANYGWLMAQVQHYCKELEKSGKYTLLLWPYHTIVGTPGHAVVGVIQEARMFHSFVRGTQSNVEIKGGHPLTENYSVLRPEVLTRHDGKPLTQKNVAFIKKLIESDAVIAGGQAASHCYLSTIDDLLNEILNVDPTRPDVGAALAKKVYLMTDTTSSVTVPDSKGGFIADYTPQAEAAFQRFADKGMNLVKSTDPMESWPGLQL